MACRQPSGASAGPYRLLAAPRPFSWQDADPSERIIAPMRWGLVPFWFREEDPAKLQINTSNCRSDTIMEKRSFKVGEGARAGGRMRRAAAPWTPAKQPQAVSRSALSAAVCAPVDRAGLFLPLSCGLPGPAGHVVPNQRFLCSARVAGQLVVQVASNPRVPPSAGMWGGLPTCLVRVGSQASHAASCPPSSEWAQPRGFMALPKSQASPLLCFLVYTEPA